MRPEEIKAERNARVSARYDALMRGGKHGHYETMFKLVREEVEAAVRVVAQLLNDEAGTCMHVDPVPGDKEGIKLSMARAGALLTARNDVLALHGLNDD